MCGNIPGEDRVKVKGDFYQGFETSDIFNTLEKYIWIYEYTYVYERMVKGQLPLLSRSSAVFTGFSKVEATITANIMFWYWRPSCHMSIHISDCLPSWRTQWRTCQTVQMWRGRRSWTSAFDFSAKVLSSPRADQHTLKHQKSWY